MMVSCPCGSSKTYEECCGPYLSGSAIPRTAEDLMRSRYTAYTKKDSDYLLKSWHPSTRPHPKSLNLQGEISWTGLEIVSTMAGKGDHENGIVEFVARFFSSGQIKSIHEKNSFIKVAGKWYYVDGEILQGKDQQNVKVGRNDPCPCGSGRKYKKCCLR